MNTPKVTIISSVYNDAFNIEETINSVLNQTYQNIEYIIIDGGSTDGTAEVIEKYSDRLAYWSSEKDNGYYDGWNKGLEHATGNLIGILNSGDLYQNDAVSNVVKHFAENPEALFYGTVKYFSGDINNIVSVNNVLFNPKKIHIAFGFIHTSVFVPAFLYDRLGRFTTKYDIAADTEFLLRCYKAGVEFKNANNTTFMRTGGVSEKRKFVAQMEYILQLAKAGFPEHKILISFLKYYAKSKLKISFR